MISTKKMYAVENAYSFDRASAKIVSSTHFNFASTLIKVRMPTNYKIYYLTFKFSCKEDGVVTVHYFVKEDVNDTLGTKE